jgi:hypothetical protein
MVSSHPRRARWVTSVITLFVGVLIAGLTAATTPTARADTSQVAGAPVAAVGVPVAARALPAEFAAVASAESANLACGGVRQRIHFHFDKNQKDPTNSRLILYRVTYSADQPARYTKLGSWRAGSGLGTGTGAKDACASDKGWLPNGSYDGGIKGDPVVYHTNFDRGVIFGTVWHLQNKHCKPNGKGIKRTELFIHSEMTPDRTQACSPGVIDGPQCWEGPTDYVSLGCIKLKPSDIAAAARLAQANGGPKPGKKHYRNLLIVTN